MPSFITIIVITTTFLAYLQKLWPQQQQKKKTKQKTSCDQFIESKHMLTAILLVYFHRRLSLLRVYTFY